MESSSSADMLAYDPSKTSNRPPTPFEIKALRGLQALNRQEYERLQVELASAKEMLADVDSRYQKIKLEFEAVLSEMHATQRLVNRVEKQVSALEVENEELKKSLHPLRRCPEDILRQIFITAYQQAWDDEYGQPRRLVRYISQVCQRWREISIDISRLWIYLNINWDHKPADISAKADLAVSRMRSEGAFITIYEENGLSVENLKAAHFNSFRRIDLVHIQLKKLSILQNPECGYNSGPLKCMRIDQLLSTEWNEGLSLDRLLTNFPTLEKLELQSIPSAEISTILTRSFTSLDALHLGHTDIPLHIVPWSLLPNLRELSLRNITCTPPDPPEAINIPSLRVLRLSLNISVPITTFTTPHIETLVLDILTGQEEIDFVCNLKELTDLTIDIDEGNYKCLYDWVDEPSKLPPFPRLSLLTLDMQSSLSDISLEEFEKLVLARCLPRSETDPRTRTFSLIKELTVINANGRLLPTPPWRKSNLIRRHSIFTTSTKDDLSIFRSPNFSINYYPFICLSHMTWIV